MSQKRKIIIYKEILAVSAGENNEPLVDIRIYDPDIIANCEKKDMIPYTGSDIFVRDAVAKKLAKAQKNIRRYGKLRLKIVYGYRHPEIQKKYFKQRRAELKKLHPSLNNEGLDSLTHNFIAVPTVAGHPTGGAIDVTIVDAKEKELDMGTKIADFKNAERIKTFAKGLSNKQRSNRLLLRNILIQEKFAPFYGEWWHFSYGDREWACFYGKKKSLYSPINFKVKN